MKKFIGTAEKILTPEQRAFYKMLSFMQSYAQCCLDMVPFDRRTDETSSFGLIVRGLNMPNKVKWQQETTKLCENTISLLVPQEFPTQADFYETFSQPISKSNINPDAMEKIFDTMAEIITRRHSQLFAEKELT